VNGWQWQYQDAVNPHEKFSASKNLFYSLVRLNALIAHSSKEELLPLEGLCVQVSSTLLQARKLSLSTAFRHSLCDFYATLLNKGTSVNVYMVIKDMQVSRNPLYASRTSSAGTAHLLQGILMASRSVPVLSRVAALEVLARVFRQRARQIAPHMLSDCIVVIAKQLKSSEPALREAALVALAAGGLTAKAEIFKALKATFADRNPEVKGGIATCLQGMVREAEDFATVPLDALLTLGLKGLEDPSVKVQLLYAEAMAYFLSLSVAGHALQSKAKIIKAARGEDEDQDDKEGGGGQLQSGMDKAVAKLKEMGVAGVKRASPSTFTFESAIQYLISLFLKAASGAPFSQGSISAVLVAFLRRHRANYREDTLQVRWPPVSRKGAHS
jgi:hypothetical protein